MASVFVRKIGHGIRGASGNSTELSRQESKNRIVGQLPYTKLQTIRAVRALRAFSCFICFFVGFFVLFAFCRLFLSASTWLYADQKK
jgi:hypothetical protein